MFCEHRQVILDRQVEQLAWEEENEKANLLDLKILYKYKYKINIIVWLEVENVLNTRVLQRNAFNTIFISILRQLTSVQVIQEGPRSEV